VLDEQRDRIARLLLGEGCAEILQRRHRLFVDFVNDVPGFEARVEGGELDRNGGDHDTVQAAEVGQDGGDLLVEGQGEDDELADEMGIIADEIGKTAGRVAPLDDSNGLLNLVGPPQQVEGDPVADGVLEGGVEDLLA
jgi:hypothetical protein